VSFLRVYSPSLAFPRVPPLRHLAVSLPPCSCLRCPYVLLSGCKRCSITRATMTVCSGYKARRGIQVGSDTLVRECFQVYIVKWVPPCPRFAFLTPHLCLCGVVRGPAPCGCVGGQGGLHPR
jgi:hypothetical protein